MINTAGMLAQVDAELAKLQAFRAALAAFSGNGSPPPATRVPRAKPAARRNGRKPKAVSRLHPKGESNDQREKAAALWAEGRTIAQISTKLGIRYQTVYGWKKGWPEQGDAPAGEAPQRFRCQHCKQFGVDSKRCDHCMEKR